MLSDEYDASPTGSASFAKCACAQASSGGATQQSFSLFLARARVIGGAATCAPSGHAFAKRCLVLHFCPLGCVGTGGCIYIATRTTAIGLRLRFWIVIGVLLPRHYTMQASTCHCFPKSAFVAI